MDGIGEHLKWSLLGSEGQKLDVLPHARIVDLKRNWTIILAMGQTLRGNCTREE
jgi:hypothetical protein